MWVEGQEPRAVTVSATEWSVQTNAPFPIRNFLVRDFELPTRNPRIMEPSLARRYFGMVFESNI